MENQRILPGLYSSTVRWWLESPQTLEPSARFTTVASGSVCTVVGGVRERGEKELQIFLFLSFTDSNHLSLGLTVSSSRIHHNAGFCCTSTIIGFACITVNHSTFRMGRDIAIKYSVLLFHWWTIRGPEWLGEIRKTRVQLTYYCFCLLPNRIVPRFFFLGNSLPISQHIRFGWGWPEYLWPSQQMPRSSGWHGAQVWPVSDWVRCVLWPQPGWQRLICGIDLEWGRRALVPIGVVEMVGDNPGTAGDYLLMTKENPRTDEANTAINREEKWTNIDF